ncbi:MAG: ribonuclease P protein component, partial [Bacteroidia bacterium]|nr:ribonuclease P protein component [Bacteroidia bacterium]
MDARRRACERLRHKKRFDELFRKGRSFGCGPLRLVYRCYPSTAIFPRIFTAFLVSKKTMAKAAHRNRAKRLVREAFRLSKKQFYERLPDGMAVDMAWIYRETKPLDFTQVQEAMIK